MTDNNRRLYEDKLKIESELQAVRDEKRRYHHDQELLSNNYEDLVERFQEKERGYEHLISEKEKLDAEVNHLRLELENVII